MCLPQATLLFSKAKEDPELPAESSKTSSVSFRYWKQAKADPPGSREFFSAGLQRLGKISHRAARKNHQPLKEHYSSSSSLVGQTIQSPSDLPSFCTFGK